VTSDQAETTREQLEWLGISGFFHTIVTRDRVKQGKPAPEMAETACRELGLLPVDTVIIGDSNADMQLGKGAGLRLAVGISPNGSTAHLRDADIVISGSKTAGILFFSEVPEHRRRAAYRIFVPRPVFTRHSITLLILLK
jgi:phosphoglycolate phosphatase